MIRVKPTTIDGQQVNGVNATLTTLINSGTANIEYSLVFQDEQGNSVQVPDSTKVIELTESELSVLADVVALIENKILTNENLTK